MPKPSASEEEISLINLDHSPTPRKIINNDKWIIYESNKLIELNSKQGLFGVFYFFKKADMIFKTSFFVCLFFPSARIVEAILAFYPLPSLHQP